MSLQPAKRVLIKRFIESGAPESEEVVPPFHQWIRDALIEGELLIDVADYAHVHEGPSVLLVGHGIDIAFDHGLGRPGIYVFRKRGFDGDLDARIENALQILNVAVARFEKDFPEVKFSDELSLSIVDRLHAPNTDAGFEDLKSLSAPILEQQGLAVVGRHNPHPGAALGLLAKNS